MAITAKNRAEHSDDFAVVRFLRETFDELRKVVWPTPPELYRYTMVVVATVLVIALFIGAVDYGVGEFVRRYIYAHVTKG